MPIQSMRIISLYFRWPKNKASIGDIETSPERVSASPIRSSLTPTGVDIAPKHALHERPQGSQRFLKTSDGSKKESRL